MASDIGKNRAKYTQCNCPYPSAHVFRVFVPVLSTSQQKIVDRIAFHLRCRPPDKPLLAAYTAIDSNIREVRRASSKFGYRIFHFGLEPPTN